MKKGLMIILLCLSLFLPDNTPNEVLKAGIASSDFGVAFIGIAAALLMRDNKKK